MSEKKEVIEGKKIELNSEGLFVDGKLVSKSKTIKNKVIKGNSITIGNKETQNHIIKGKKD